MPKNRWYITLKPNYSPPGKIVKQYWPGTVHLDDKGVPYKVIERRVKNPGSFDNCTYTFVLELLTKEEMERFEANREAYLYVEK